MPVNDTLANTARAAHDVGLAAWLGGAMFGKFAHNPSLAKITNHHERGSVANDAWGRYNVINTVGMGAAAVGWAAARVTQARSERLSGTEQRLARAKDWLMGIALLTGAASGVAGAGLAKQMPDGAVPIETGTGPAPETPEAAARLQRVISVMSILNIVSGVALVAVNGVMAQINYSHPSGRRALAPLSATGPVSPAWISAALATAGAAIDQGRRQLA